MSETKHVNADPSSLGALASAINKGDSPILGTFTVVTPLAKQGNVYEGILKYKSVGLIIILIMKFYILAFLMINILVQMHVL